MEYVQWDIPWTIILKNTHKFILSETFYLWYVIQRFPQSNHSKRNSCITIKYHLLVKCVHNNLKWIEDSETLFSIEKIKSSFLISQLSRLFIGFNLKIRLVVHTSKGNFYLKILYDFLKSYRLYLYESSRKLQTIFYIEIHNPEQWFPTFLRLDPFLEWISNMEPFNPNIVNVCDASLQENSLLSKRVCIFLRIKSYFQIFSLIFTFFKDYQYQWYF